MHASVNLIQVARSGTGNFSATDIGSILHEPVIVVSAPRSGSNLLFERLMRIPGFWTIGGESHAIFREFPHLRAENSRLDSGSLGAGHADAQTCERVRSCFLYLLRDDTGMRYLDRAPPARPATVRMLEKTPRNALNIPFLLQVFPDARFVYLRRGPRESVASLIEAWTVGLQTGRFTTFTDLPGWDRQAWCFLLPPGWRSMMGKSLAEIAAFQWLASNEAILENLLKLPKERWTSISYESLVRNSAEEINRLAAFARIDFANGERSHEPLRLSRTALTPPHPDKWKKHEREIASLLPALRKMSDRIETACA